MSDVAIDGRLRAVVENVTPRVDDGAFPVKRVVGDTLVVEADAFADGHDEVRAVLRWSRTDDGRSGTRVEMEPLGNDRWRASFALAQIGRYEYTVTGWVDHWRTWRHDLQKRVEAGQDVTVDLQIGARSSQPRQRARQAPMPRRWQARPQSLTADQRAGRRSSTRSSTAIPDRSLATTLERPLTVTVDPERAPLLRLVRAVPALGVARPEAPRHVRRRHRAARRTSRTSASTSCTCRRSTHRPPVPQGPEQPAVRDQPRPRRPVGDRGVRRAATPPSTPSSATSTTSIAWSHAARQRGIEVALDIAFQASPDHPWVTEHPEWFRARPDGTIQYAENPPKKYQDIYPFDFESERLARPVGRARRRLPLLDRARRDDLPRRQPAHQGVRRSGSGRSATSSATIPRCSSWPRRSRGPRSCTGWPSSASASRYTYFTWRNSAAEMREYLEELTPPPVNDFFRPNFWPNTPDILHADLQTGGRAAFEARLRARRDPVGELRHLRPGLRARGAHAARARARGVPRLGEVPAAHVGPRRGRDTPARPDHAGQRLGASTRRCRRTSGCGSTTIDNRTCSPTPRTARISATSILTIVNFDYRRTPRRGVLELGPGRTGPARRSRRSEVVDLLDDCDVPSGPARAIPVELDPQRVRVAHYVLWRRAPMTGRAGPTVRQTRSRNASVDQPSATG